MTLLSLFTHIQLDILGRSKYIQSVLEQAYEERERERRREGLTFAAIFSALEGQEFDPELQDVDYISEETERKYLTLSWWILHVGWKDVGERVRRAVEEVFEGSVAFTYSDSRTQYNFMHRVSLKTKLSAADLHRLISDVRRRVEFEVTFEGRERRIK